LPEVQAHLELAIQLLAIQDTETIPLPGIAFVIHRNTFGAV
jgi:hypothetical protein